MSITTFFKFKQEWVRHVAHVVFWIFIFIAIGFQTGFIFLGGRHKESFLVFLALLSSFGLLAPYLLFRFVPWFRGRINNRTLGFVEFMSALAMGASWIGTFGMYEVSGYDSSVHFFSSALIAIMLTGLVMAIEPRMKSHPFRIFFIVAILISIGGIVNELFEWGGDQFFGTTMFGEVGQPDDTQRDIIANSMGIIFGSAVGYQARSFFLKYINHT